MADANPYPPLFRQYKAELRALYDELTKARDAVVELIAQDEGIDLEAARERHDVEEGPLVHEPRVIHLIRKYWLEVARLKDERYPKGLDFLEPLTFLVEDLEDDDEEELVDFLTEIAYWPIGLDENNKWS